MHLYIFVDLNNFFLNLKRLGRKIFKTVTRKRPQKKKKKKKKKNEGKNKNQYLPP